MTTVLELQKPDRPESNLPGLVRKLWPGEAERFRDHLLRLDEASRRMRFAHGVSDSFIEGYASRMSEPGAMTFAYMEDDIVRAAGELKQSGGPWGLEAEAALSVEQTHQDRGLGTELLGRVLRAARNRGVQHVTINCLAGNERMQAIARKHDAGLRIEQGDVIAEITPDGFGYFSSLEDVIEDREASAPSAGSMSAALARSARNPVSAKCD